MDEDLQTRFISLLDKYPLPKESEYKDTREIINKLMDHAVTYLHSVDDPNVLTKFDDPDLFELVHHDIPEGSQSIDNLEQFLKKVLIPNFMSTGNRRFLAYIPSDPLPQSMVFAALTPLFNQFTGSVQGSPGGTAIEALAITWIAELLGFPDSTFGSFTSGGSMANLTAIYTGMVHQLRVHGIDLKVDGLIGQQRPIFYISDQTHNAIEKALLMLGVGKKSIHRVRSNSRYQLTANAVQQAIDSDIEQHGDDVLPLMIIATAGTTNTGSIDELTGLRELASTHNMWFHIDGAYGAFTRMTDHPVSRKLDALPTCDSIALDCHKWLYTPFEAGIVLVREHTILRTAFDLSAEYLKDSEIQEDHTLKKNFRSYGFPLTRELRGLKVWAVISSLGRTGVVNAITRDLIKAEYLRDKISDHSDFELVPHGKLSVVCFRYKGSDDENDKIMTQLQNNNNFYLSRTDLDGRPVFRACIINRRSDLDLIDELVVELASIVTTLFKE